MELLSCLLELIVILVLVGVAFTIALLILYGFISIIGIFFS